MTKNISVFLSYSEEKRDSAGLVKSELEKSGISVKIDTDDIRAGKEWRHEIDTLILDADAFVVVLDKCSVDSPYVTYEWAFALGNRKPIIPVIFEECKIHSRMEVMQYLDFTGKYRPWDKQSSSIIEAVANDGEWHSNEYLLVSRKALLGVHNLFKKTNISEMSEDRRKSEHISRIEGYLKDLIILLRDIYSLTTDNNMVTASVFYTFDGNRKGKGKWEQPITTRDDAIFKGFDLNQVMESPEAFGHYVLTNIAYDFYFLQDVYEEGDQRKDENGILSPIYRLTDDNIAKHRTFGEHGSIAGLRITVRHPKNLQKYCIEAVLFISTFGQKINSQGLSREQIETCLREYILTFFKKNIEAELKHLYQIYSTQGLKSIYKLLSYVTE